MIKTEDFAKVKKMYVLGHRGDHWVTVPDPDYFGPDVEGIFDEMQADGIIREQIGNLSSFESEGIYWEKERR